MADSIMLDRYGPDWPLGLVLVPAPGTPVRFTSLVDPTAKNAPEAATTATSDIQTPSFQQIMLQGFRKAGPPGLQANQGYVYVVRAGKQGAGNAGDYGAIVAVIQPGETFFLASSASRNNVYNPYRYYIDADVANDGLLITGIVQ